MQCSELNKNPLTKPRFKFVCDKIPYCTFFCQTANIPGITLGEYSYETPIKNIPIPGDKLIYDDFSFGFIVNENLDNWMEIKDWLSDIGFDSELSTSNEEFKNLFAEGSLFVLSDKMNPIIEIKFQDMFPISLGALEFDITDTDDTPVIAEVSFKYLKYSYTVI